MFLGQSISFTRSSNQLSFTAQNVGAVHLDITGYTAVRITAPGLDKTFDAIEDGFNLLDFPNTVLSSLNFAFTGTGSVDWTTAGLFKTDIALTDENKHERPYSFSPVLDTSEAGPYQANPKILGEFGFEWRYLAWSRVDALEVLFDRLGVLGDPRFTLIPDEFEGDRYLVVITSPFDFYPSVPEYFHNGASGALVFSTID